MSSPHSPASTDVLESLPEVIQNAVAVLAILTTVGFEESAINYEQMPARSLGVDRDEMVLLARLIVGDRDFSYALGLAITDAEAWLARGTMIWRRADQATREAFYRTSALFRVEHFGNLLRGLEEVGIRPPKPLGLAIGELRRSGIADAVGRSAQPSPVAAPAPPPRPRPRPAAPAPTGPRRFEPGKLDVGKEAAAELMGVDLAPFVERHAAGDWGESAYVEENEAALRDGRAVLSVFRTDGGRRFWIVTWAARTKTSVMVHNEHADERLALDLVCRHVCIGAPKSPEIVAASNETLYAVPLFARNGPSDGSEAELAAMVLAYVIGEGRTGHVPPRPEQLFRELARSVTGVDFRPIDRNGRPVPKDAPQRKWQQEADRCKQENIGAWFAATWEERLH